MTPTPQGHQGRFDLYGPPHKGLRHAHGAMLNELGRADFTQPQGALLERLKTHLSVAARHLDEENRFIHPLLEQRAPHSTERLVIQHHEHETHFGRLNDLIAAVECADSNEAMARGRDLYLSFTQLVGMDLGHMDEEEQATWPLLCAHFTDEEMRGIVGHVLEDFPLDALAYFLGHMAGALTTVELAETVAGMRASMPAAAFAQTMAAGIEAATDAEGREGLLALNHFPS